MNREVDLNHKGFFTPPGSSQQTWAAIRLVFYVLLAVWLVVDLIDSAFQWVERRQGPNSITAVRAFDSFSQPATAMQVLRQEADQRMLNYMQGRDAHPAATLDRWSPGLCAAEPGALNAGSAEDSLGALRELQLGLQGLSTDLDQKLLLVYFENRRANPFLDRFLHFLREAPENPQVLPWVEVALDCSAACGRTAEVEDAIKDVLRFHGNLKTATSLKERLALWQSKQVAKLASYGDELDEKTE